MRPCRSWPILLLALSLAGCGESDFGGYAKRAPAAAPPVTTPPTATMENLRGLGYVAQSAEQRPQAVAAAPAANAPPSALQSMTAARKLIRTGHLQIEVKRYEEAAEAAGRIAERHGGYLADSQTSRAEDDRQQGSLTLRVPAERFPAAMAALKALGKVRAETVKTDDVTKAYADLETRLSVKRDTAERLRQILRTQTAKLSDLLEAERELARVTEQIEQMEGERRFYDQQTALSTLNVALHEPQALVQAGVFAPIGEALRDSLEVLANSLAALIYVAVFLTPWVLILYLLWRLWRARRARRLAVAPVAATSPLTTTGDKPGDPA
jgi:hypothetical protein